MRRTSYQRGILVALSAVLVVTTVANAAPEEWDFDIYTEGADVLWTSPTAVDPDADTYEVAWEISLLEVTVHYLLWDFTVDVTDQIPPEFQNGQETADGPAPIVVFDDYVVYPEPPEPPGFEAHIVIGLDATGHGYVNVTEVTLGQVTVEIPGFGEVTTELEAVRVAGTVWAEAFFDPWVLGDMNCDGVVDFDDISPFVLALGGQSGYEAAYPECNWYHADCDNDGDVDFDDINPFIALLGG